MTTTAKFTNKSGKTVLVLDAMSEASTSPKQGYGQTLTLLTFEDGGTTLVSEKETTLNLKQTTISNLLISDPATLFPIKSVGEGPDYSAPDPWPKPNKPILVDTSDVEAMAQALQFRQNILANPSSAMATAFQAALTTAQAEGTSDKMLADMDAFFKKYPSFSKVTYPAYTAVESYLKTFALLWVQPNAASLSVGAMIGASTIDAMIGASTIGATYYIYSVPDADKKGANSEGTIQATKQSSNSGNADPTDHLSGYTVMLKGNGSSVALSYSDGVFQDSDGGAISLTATYSYKSTFTGSISDVTLWPILTGTIDGKQVIAIPLAPESGFGRFWSNFSLSKLFSSFMEVMSLWMALDFLKDKWSSKNKSLEEAQYKNKGVDPTPVQVKEADINAEAVGKLSAKMSEKQGQKTSGDTNFKVPKTASEIQTKFQNVKDANSSANKQLATDKIEGSLESTGQTLEQLAQIENTPAINQAGQDVNAAGQAIQQGKIQQASTHLQSASTNLKVAITNLSTEISEQQKQALNDKIDADNREAEEAEEKANESSDPQDREGTGDPVEEGEIHAEIR